MDVYFGMLFFALINKRLAKQLLKVSFITFTRQPYYLCNNERIKVKTEFKSVNITQVNNAGNESPNPCNYQIQYFNGVFRKW